MEIQASVIFVWITCISSYHRKLVLGPLSKVQNILILEPAIDWFLWLLVMRNSNPLQVTEEPRLMKSDYGLFVPSWNEQAVGPPETGLFLLDSIDHFHAKWLDVDHVQSPKPPLDFFVFNGYRLSGFDQRKSLSLRVEFKSYYAVFLPVPETVFLRFILI